MKTVHSFKVVTTESEGENSLGRQFGLMSQRSLAFLWKYSRGISQKTDILMSLTFLQFLVLWSNKRDCS